MKFLDVFKAIIPSSDFNVAEIENIVMKRVENYLSADIIMPYYIDETKQATFSNEVRNIYNIQFIDFKFIMPEEQIAVETAPSAAPVQEKKEEVKEKTPLIYGKSEPVGNVEKISNIDEYYGKVIIEGTVIETDQRETKTGKIIFKFDITDKTSSISVKMFLDPKKKNLEPLDRIFKGSTLRVLGDAKYDPYDRETIIMATAISEIKIAKKKD